MNTDSQNLLRQQCQHNYRFFKNTDAVYYENVKISEVLPSISENKLLFVIPFLVLFGCLYVVEAR
jgi:hypothetical protein